MPQLAEGTLISIIVVLGGSLAFIVMPFITTRRSKKNKTVLQSQQRRDALVTHYERVLATIRDLDEDFNTGKLDDTIYHQEREQWSTMGARILQELDVNSTAIQQHAPKAGVNNSADAAMDEAIEAAIQQYLQTQSRG